MSTFIKEESLNWALEHCKKYSYNFFPILFEYEAIERDWDNIKKFILSQSISNWKARPSRRFICPKQKFGFRIITELDPLDHIIFSSLLYEIGFDIESKRIQKERDIVISYRFMPNDTGNIFDSDYNYKYFINLCGNIAEFDEYQYVAITDISDFFLHIYEHRLENALNQATSKKDHIKGIINLLKQWNAKVSTGIPIGPIVSRFLSEIAIIDIDKLLILENINYVRWCDDFRIFVNSYSEGYKAISILAEYLNENHNMTLQESKTEIITSKKFIEKYISPEQRIELNEIDEELVEIIGEMGLCTVYELFNVEISDDVREKIESLNLGKQLHNQIQKENINYMFLRHIINLLIKIKDDEHLEYLVDNIEKLYPVFNDILRFFIEIEIEPMSRKKQLANKLIDIYNDSIISSMPYEKMLIMSCFSCNPEMADASQLVKLYQFVDDNIKREIFLVMGKKKEDAWIRSWKKSWNNFSPWVKRGFLEATKCLPVDEKIHYYNSIRSKLDPLEKAIIKEE